MNRISVVLLLMLVCIGVMAEPLKGGGSLSGKVTDKRSGEALVGVAIFFPGLQTGTVTDADGKYSKETSILDTIQFCPCFAVSGLARACFCSKPA